MTARERVVVIGYGNPGRRDDGLGPRFAEAVGEWGLEGVTVEEDYQLNVEDAALVAAHDVAVFADAHSECEPPFVFGRLKAGGAPGFTSHSVSPGAVLELAREHFSARPRAFLLGIRGYDFEGFGEGLGRKALENLEAALLFFRPMLENRTFEGAKR